MRCNPVSCLGAVVLAGGFLLAGQTTPGGEAAKPVAGRLIRRDLLSGGAAEIVPPRRDIFRAKPAFTQPGFAAPQSASVTPVPVPSPEPEPEETVPDPSLDLTYVGYISSPQRTVALVIVEGQAQAVAEGEEILPGVKIEKVSRDKISLVGPGAKRTVVPLQGEES